jgi:Ca2+-binding RTX toxin-like protein
VCIYLQKGSERITSGCTNVHGSDPTIDIAVTEPGQYLVIARGGSGTSHKLSIECVPETSCSTPEYACNGLAATIIGTDGDNILVGTEGRDVITGRGGNDLIYGLGGNDILCGDAGNDIILGGEGKDRMLGGRGNDMLFGEAGDDKLVGSNGNDLLDGGEDDDNLNGGSGSDVCDGSSDVVSDVAVACELTPNVP